jgi:hypothetical protein
MNVKTLDELGLEDEWNDAALCPPPFLVVSEKYGLVAHPQTGAIGPMHPPKDAAEEAQHYRNYQAYVAETCVPGLECDEPTDRLDLDPDDLVDTLEGDAAGQRGKRRVATQICHYSACRQTITTLPITCPPGTEESAPDLPYPFCSFACGKAWALYELGMPLCDRICSVLDVRAGFVVDPAPAPFEAMMAQMSDLTLSKQQGSKVSHLDPDDEAPHLCVGLPLEAQQMDESQDAEEVEASEPVVACRSCNQKVPVSSAVRQVWLETAAVWCFCSITCVRTSPAYSTGDLMDPVAFADLESRGHRELLRRPRWGSEPNDV